MLGALVSVLSLRDWIANERAMRAGERLPASRLPVLVSVVIATVGVLAVVISAFGAAK